MSFKAVITAFQFLTIVPIKTRWDVTEKDLVRSVVFFPFVGLFQGLIVSSVVFFGQKFFSLDVSVVFALLAYIFTTGGFHQDGLSDTFDALCVKSSGDKEKDREKRLSVMKGSTAGPIGVMAIIFSLILKFLLIRDIALLADFPIAYLFFLLMPVFAKSAMVWTLSGARSARKDGLGRILLDETGYRQSVVSTCLLFAISFGMFFLSRFVPSLHNLWTIKLFFYFLLSEFFVVWCLTTSIDKMLSIRFSGLTGDNVGAMHEISEIIFLIVVLLWL